MVLIIFAHPYPAKSHANKHIIRHLENFDDIVISNLYEKYPDFYIDVKAEQKLLLAADLVIFHFPFYWYNVPAMLKHWQEKVLSQGFAFGNYPEENKLKDKKMMAVITAGHKERSYQKGAFDNYSMDELLSPLKQLSAHCSMKFLEPHILFQAHKASEADLDKFSLEYKQLIQKYHHGQLNMDKTNE